MGRVFMSEDDSKPDENNQEVSEMTPYLSPLASMTYAFTPPGILTSTRISTREKALKQLERVYQHP